MDSTTDYYAVLEVLPTAEAMVIQAAYRALAQRYHPDRFEGDKDEANRKMASINEAHDVLSDPIRRAQYDSMRCADEEVGGSQTEVDDSNDVSAGDDSQNDDDDDLYSPASQPIRSVVPRQNSRWLLILGFLVSSIGWLVLRNTLLSDAPVVIPAPPPEIPHETYLDEHGKKTNAPRKSMQRPADVSPQPAPLPPLRPSYGITITTDGNDVPYVGFCSPIGLGTGSSCTGVESGDVILAIEGQPVKGFQDVRAKLLGVPYMKEFVTLDVRRGRKEIQIRVKPSWTRGPQPYGETSF